MGQFVAVVKLKHSSNEVEIVVTSISRLMAATLHDTRGRSCQR